MPQPLSKVHWALLCLALARATAARAQDVVSSAIDLAQAIDLAHARSPLLQAARARIEEAQGELTGASLLLLNNPELEVTAGPRIPRSSSGEIGPNLELGLSQRFEIGGQRKHRVGRASDEVRAATAEAANARRVLDLAVASAFYGALADAERARIAEENERLSGQLLEIASVRVRQGAEQPLVEDGARIRTAEARRQAFAARAAERTSRIRLLRILGLPQATALGLQGQLPGSGSLSGEPELVARALAERPDLTALARSLDAARSSVALADAKAWPDVTVGVRYGLDEFDHVIGATLGIGLPFFDRNQGERQSRRATAARMEADLAALRAEVEAEVREAYARYTAASQSAVVYGEDVLRAQDESLDLLRRAYEAGKSSFAELVLLQREVQEGRAGFVEARLELALAQSTALAAAGASVLPGGTR